MLSRRLPVGKRRKIAVFTSHVYEPMSGLMQKGIKAAALDRGVKVIFFASFSDSYSSRNFEEFSRYDEGDSIAFDIPDLDDFDGIIKMQTFFGARAKQRVNEIARSAKIPVVNIGGFDDDLHNICCDEMRSYGETVEHLIVRHGCRDIYHLAGLSDKIYTAERIESYKSVLLKHGIPFDENKVYYGNLWRDCGEAALDYIMEDCAKRGKKLPDAVCCANDYSAIGLINACKARGIIVPDDMLVTGYDGVDDAINGYPSLTTSRQPFYNAGYEAVNYLISKWEGEEMPDTVHIMGDLMINQSCGCKSMTADNIDDVRDKFLRRLKTTTNVSQSTTNLMLGVSDAETLEDCFRSIGKNARSATGFKDMLMCLAPDWDKQRVVGEEYSKVDEEMTVVTGFRGNDEVPQMTFRKKDILPRDMLDDPYPYYIFTIHHLQYYMGYLIVSPESIMREQESMQSWFVDLAVMLENQRIRRDLKYSVERLEALYNKDVLTGIYNRRGSEMYFEQYYSESRRNKKGLAVMLFDMDDLKVINDNYGHTEGDYSIKTIADALTSAAGDDELCTRSGGDEFVVIAKNYDEAKVTTYIDNVRSFIESRRSQDKKEYLINISVGTHIEIPSGDGDQDLQKVFEEYLKIADTAMYEQKREHKGQV